MPRSSPRGGMTSKSARNGASPTWSSSKRMTRIDPQMRPYVNLNTREVDVSGALLAGVSREIVEEVVGKDPVDRLLNPTQTQIEAMFEQGKADGTIQSDATLVGYNPDKLALELTVPGPELTGEQVLQQLIDEGEAPVGSTFVSYDKEAGEVTYMPPPEPPKPLDGRQISLI